MDLAVIDPATRSLVLRAGGVDSSHGNTTLIRENRELRAAAAQSFDAATGQMIEHLDTALTAFESEVRAGPRLARLRHAGCGCFGHRLAKIAGRAAAPRPPAHLPRLRLRGPRPLKVRGDPAWSGYASL